MYLKAKIPEVHYENRSCQLESDRVTVRKVSLWYSWFCFAGSASSKSHSHLFCLMLLCFGECNHGLCSNCLLWDIPSVWSTSLTNKGFHMLRGNWQIVWIHNRKYTKVSSNCSNRKMLQWSNIWLLKSWLTTRSVILLDMTFMYNW